MDAQGNPILPNPNPPNNPPNNNNPPPPPPLPGNLNNQPPPQPNPPGPQRRQDIPNGVDAEQFDAMFQRLVTAASQAAAIAVANAFNATQNPTNMANLLQTFRKYDGEYAANIWIEEFNAERQLYGLDDAWALNNLDRFLVGNPKQWWSTQKTQYVNMVRDMGANPVRVWTNASTALSTFFNTDAIKERARGKNKSIRYESGSEAIKYVTEKLQCLHNINPFMKEDEKVHSLLVGLPHSVRMSVGAGPSIRTHDEFLERLNNHIKLNTKTSSTPVPLSSIPALPLESPQLGVAQIRRFANAPNTAERSTRTCNYCTRVGHIERFCWKKADDEGRPRPLPTSRATPAAIANQPRSVPARQGGASATAQANGQGNA
jgi:hypothetical protein